MSSQSKTTALGFIFDASQITPAAPMEAVPAGWYSVLITDGETKPTGENGEGRRLALEFTIQEGQFKGRKIFDGFNVVHGNPKAAQIAAEQLSAVCHAVGVYQVQDVSQLFNRPFQIKVDVEAGRTVDEAGDPTDRPAGSPGTKTYDAKNRFKGAKAGSAPVATTAGAAGAAAPAWATNTATKAPAPAPAASTITTPPWATSTPAAPAPAAATPPPAGKPAAKGKPGPKPKPAAAAPAKPERKFFVGVEAAEFAEAVTESALAGFFAKGLPAETPIVLEGEENWKTAAEYGVALTPAPVAAVAPVAPPAAPASGNLPPWAR